MDLPFVVCRLYRLETVPRQLEDAERCKNPHFFTATVSAVFLQTGDLDLTSCRYQTLFSIFFALNFRTSFFYAFLSCISTRQWAVYNGGGARGNIIWYWWICSSLEVWRIVLVTEQTWMQILQLRAWRKWITWRKSPKLLKKFLVLTTMWSEISCWTFRKLNQSD